MIHPGKTGQNDVCNHILEAEKAGSGNVKQVATLEWLNDRLSGIAYVDQANEWDEPQIFKKGTYSATARLLGNLTGHWCKLFEVSSSYIMGTVMGRMLSNRGTNSSWGAGEFVIRLRAISTGQTISGAWLSYYGDANPKNALCIVYYVKNGVYTVEIWGYVVNSNHDLRCDIVAEWGKLNSSTAVQVDTLFTKSVGIAYTASAGVDALKTVLIEKGYPTNVVTLALQSI